MRSFYIYILFTVSLLSSFSQTSTAQSLKVQWAMTLQGTGSIRISDLVSDNAGNIYITGYFSNKLDLDPGPDTAYISPGPIVNCFLAKYNAIGKLVFGYALDAEPTSMGVDNYGNVYLAGTFRGKVDFDPGPDTAVTHGSLSDIFIAKYDARGKYVYALRIGGSETENVARIAVEKDGSVYLTGMFENKTDLDPSSAVHELIAEYTSPTIEKPNIFLAKYTASGSLLYGFNIKESNVPRCISLDPKGNVTLAGTFSRPTDLDPGPGTALFDANGSSTFVAKYDASGNYLSAYIFDTEVNCMAFDPNGNMHVTGYIRDSVDVDPGPGIKMLYATTHTNYSDRFLAKYTPAGKCVYARIYKGSMGVISYRQIETRDLTVDQRGKAYLHGHFMDTLVLDDTNRNGTFIPQNRSGFYFSKFDDTGRYAYADIFPYGNWDSRIAFDQNTDIWMAGSFGAAVIDIDPGPGLYELKDGIAFIAKFRDTTELPATSIMRPKQDQPPIKIYSAGQNVIIDLTALDGVVDADVKVMNLMGQTLIAAKHKRNDMLKLPLPDIAAQVCVVVVSNGGQTIAKKVWIQ